MKTLNWRRALPLTILTCCVASVCCSPRGNAQGVSGTVGENSVGQTTPTRTANPGELEIRQSLPLTSAQRAELQKLVRNDVEAQTLWANLKKEADAALKDTPRPLAEIFYEGIVDTDPRRISTVQSLYDMDKLAVLTQAYAFSGEAAYHEKAKEIILAWVRTFKPTGNTINENKLEPVFFGYGTMRDSFSASEKGIIETWMRQIAEKESTRYQNIDKPGAAKDNWHSKRVKIVGTIGILLNDKNFIDYGTNGYKLYIADGLYADGTSNDLKHRDALSYHASGLQPLLIMAAIAQTRGINLPDGDFYTYVAPNGASMRKSVEYVVPFANGVLTREEWKNTLAELDRQRAAAGISYYKPGKPFDPKSAVGLLEAASWFDPTLVRLVSMLKGTTASNYPTTLVLLNRAAAHTK